MNFGPDALEIHPRSVWVAHLCPSATHFPKYAHIFRASVARCNAVRNRHIVLNLRTMYKSTVDYIVWLNLQHGKKSRRGHFLPLRSALHLHPSPLSICSVALSPLGFSGISSAVEYLDRTRKKRINYFVVFSACHELEYAGADGWRMVTNFIVSCGQKETTQK